MNTPPTAPTYGKPISASFFVRLIAWAKSGMLVEGQGYRLRRGPNGTALELDDVKKVAAAVAPTNGRFTIKSISKSGGTAENPTYTVEFINLYFDVGGKTYVMPGTSEHPEDPPSVSISGVGKDDFLALKVTATGSTASSTLEKASNLSSLQALQAEMGYYVSPLYKLSSGSVTCDLRTGPITAMGEFAT